MSSAEYWRQRFAAVEEEAQRQADVCVEEIAEMYRDAERSVQADLERWYGRFADNNGIGLIEAKKLLTSGQLEEFRWTVEQYIEVGRRAGLSPEWLKKLENASARFHISRLESIQLQIQQQAELLYGGQLDSVDRLLRDVASNGYTRTAFAVQKGLGLAWDITALDKRRLDRLLARPWTTDGKTFRDRCWTNKSRLVSGLQSTLTQGLLRGDSPQKMTDSIKKQFGVDRYRAGRLVHTETAYFTVRSQLETFREMGVEKVEILETLDRHTCEVCGGLDGKVLPLSQCEPGMTVPPFHPNCRGDVCPYYDDMDGERAARNAEGEVYYVPADMTYREWEKAFVQDGNEKKEQEKVDNSGGSDIIKAEFETPELLKRHYEKHCGEFGNITEAEYLELANRLLQEKLSEDVEQFIRADSSISKYKFSTNEFLVVTKDRKIKTYFKPAEGANYWRYEHERN